MAQKYESIINYGVQNKKSKQEIIAALMKENELNNAGTYIEQLDKLGAFDSQDTNKPELNEGGPKVTAGTAQELGDSKAAEAMLESLEKSIEANKDNLGPVEGRVRGWNPYDTNAQSFQAQVNATKQIVGKYLEGGVLRMEDEKKYEKILPKLSDTPEVAKNKLLEVKRLIAEKYGSQVGTLGEGGYDISGFSQENKAPVEDQKLVADQLNKAYEFAQTNPEDPQSKRFMDDWKNNRIDLTTGKLKDEFREKTPYEKKLEEQGIVNPEKKQEDKDGILSRLWDATKEVVPELAGDLGNRLKNVWSNISEQSTQAKDRSIFENVLKGQETQLRNLGEVGGAVGDVATRALELAYKTGVPKETQEKIKQTATEFMQTEQGQTAISALQGGVEKWGEFKKSNPNVAKDMEAVFNIVTALPLGKGMGIAGKEAKALAGDVVEAGARTIGKNAVEEASDKVFRAVKPTLTVDRDKKTIRAVLNQANDELVNRGIKPKNLREYADGLSETRKKVWGEIEGAIGKGDGLKVDLKPIANEIKGMIDENLMRVDKAAAGRIQKIADSILSQGDKISVTDAEALKQFINAELKGTFGKFNLSNVEQNARKIITKKIGEQLDNLLSEIPGDFQSLKNKYGALRQVEDDVLKRLVVFERQNPQGLVESFSKISGVGNILKGFVPGGGGVSSIVKGVGEIALGQIQKRANDADTLVRKAFEKLSSRKGEFVPKSKILNYLKDKRPGMTIQEVQKLPAKDKISIVAKMIDGEDYKNIVKFVDGVLPESGSLKSAIIDIPKNIKGILDDLKLKKDATNEQIADFLSKVLETRDGMIKKIKNKPIK